MEPLQEKSDRYDASDYNHISEEDVHSTTQFREHTRDYYSRASFSYQRRGTFSRQRNNQYVDMTGANVRSRWIGNRREFHGHVYETKTKIHFEGLNRIRVRDEYEESQQGYYDRSDSRRRREYGVMNNDYKAKTRQDRDKIVARDRKYFYDQKRSDSHNEGEYDFVKNRKRDFGNRDLRPESSFYPKFPRRQPDNKNFHSSVPRKDRSFYL